MTTNFEKSEIYKKAVEEYNQSVYGAMLKPIHSFVLNEDEVYLIYSQWIVNDILSQMKDVYEKCKENDHYEEPVHLWYQTPSIKEITLMQNKYKAIVLWYDNWEIPKQFRAKI